MSVTLTYAELATRLGRSEEAVKSLVKRKRWRRSVGNDGLARITLDESELGDLSNPDRRAVGRPPANSSRSKGGEPRSNQAPNPVHELQARLAAAEALAGERKEVLERERERGDALARDLATAREEIGTLKARLAVPWWRRVLGAA